MKECDAVAIFTTCGLLSKVHAAIKESSSTQHVIYYSDLHHPSSETQKADPSVEKLFVDSNRKLYDFDTLMQMGESGGTTFDLFREKIFRRRGGKHRAG